MTDSKLKIIRQALSLSQKDFADKIGIKQSYYSALELGKKDISTSKVLQILFDKIGVNPEWYYNSNGDIFNSANVYIRRGKAGVKAQEELSKLTHHWEYIHQFNDLLSTNYPDLLKLQSNIRELIKFQSAIGLLDESKIMNTYIFGAEFFKQAKSFKEYKDKGLQAYKELMPYREFLSKYASMSHQFITDLKSISKEIGIPDDFEEWI